MPERRSAVMIVVDTWWEGPDGVLQFGRARIVNKSLSGACLRLKSQVAVGARLRVQSRWEEFSGVARYCRSDGNEYLVGVQRENGERALPKQPADRSVQPQGVLARGATVTPPATDAESVANNGMGDATSSVPARALSHREARRRRREILSYPGFDGSRRAEARADARNRSLPKGKDTEMGRRPMERNWMGLWGSKSEPANQGDDADAKEAPEPPTSGEKGRGAAGANAGSGAGASAEPDVLQNELLPVDEIYMAAGIVSPRRGYTINKVVDMLHSEHIGGLSKEMRRAAVMMALDAAGIAVDDVLRDAKARLEALNAYEEEQKKAREAEWARKAEEHVQMQVELEQIRVRYLERMKQNVDGVGRERARFESWVKEKQEEAQSITEAAELCLKAAPEASKGNATASSAPKETVIKIR